MKIFEPLTIGTITLKNRLVMGSMHSGLEDNPFTYKKLAAYLAERAKGGVGLIITGGIAPDIAGRVSPWAADIRLPWHVMKHRQVTKAIHKSGGKVVMQILHAGRYAYHPLSVAPSALQSPITPFKPKALSINGVEKTIRHFVRAAQYAQKAGYDGVEIMGSEGYLLHQFTAARTNKRTDQWGGSFENRIRMPLEIVRRTREAVGKNFLIVYRISILDLVDDPAPWEEVRAFAKALEKAGVDILNSGIGWHEARIPTIATMVPRGAFRFATAKLKKEVSIPVIAVNRINTPELAEEIVRAGEADLISMARPLLADPELPIKAQTGRENEINTCIACNQACLDHTFAAKRATCLVNPRAGYEYEYPVAQAKARKKVAVIGAGPAGMSCALEAARRGHAVELFEKSAEMGGQFRLAMQIPGKEEFRETLRYYTEMLKKYDVRIHTRTAVTAELLKKSGYDHVVVATGVRPREIRFPGIEKCVSYPDAITGVSKIGARVAVIGAGGIGFDVSELLTAPHQDLSSSTEKFFQYWGVDGREKKPGKPARKVFLLQRKTEAFGKTLGKTTGWIHRLMLKNQEVEMRSGCEYHGFTDQGLDISYLKSGKTVREVLPVDDVVICAGQESVNTLIAELKDFPGTVHVIGGAKEAGELDAKRAIREGFLTALEM